jgi:hypothetical protein
MGDTNTEIKPPGAAEAAPVAPVPTMGEALLKRIQSRQPETKDFKPSVPEVAPVEPAKVETTPEVKTTAGTGEGEAGKKDGEGDDENHEIVEGDTAEVQLKKLAASQKKTLKRIDKITAERNELETKLQAALAGKPGEADAATVEAPALAHIQTLDDLKAEDTRLNTWIQHLVKHAGTGLTYKGADGADITLSAEDVVNDINFWADVKAIQVPARRQFIESRDKTRTDAVEKFKPWTNQKGFTDAKAEVEKGMKPAESLLSDYDLAVQERALGRLALSDEWELVPKRKAPTGGVESAPAKTAPVVPPVNPPNSGGPPIRPAGAGPDVEALRLKMLQSPGNHAAVQAYVKAKLSASRAA